MEICSFFKGVLWQFWCICVRKGDYFRYLAEFKNDQEKKEAAEQALKGYEACLIIYCLVHSFSHILCVW